MARFNQTINAADVDMTDEGFAPLPEGEYSAIAQAASIEPTKNGRGQYVKLKIQITGPTHGGRVIFDQINFQNESAEAMRIGRRQLVSLMLAIGLQRLEDTDELLGKPFMLKLKQTKPVLNADGSEKYAAGNSVAKYMPLGGAGAASRPATVAPVQADTVAPAAPARPSGRPW